MSNESLPTQTPETIPVEQERREAEEKLEHAAEFAIAETGAIEDAAQKAAQRSEQGVSRRFRSRALSRVAVTALSLVTAIGIEGRPAEAGEGVKRKIGRVGIVLADEAERAMYEAEYRALAKESNAEQAIQRLEREKETLAIRYTGLARESARLETQIDDAEERNDAKGVRRLMDRQNVIQGEQATIQDRVAKIIELQEELAESAQAAGEKAEKKGKLGTGARIGKRILIEILRR